MWRVGLCVQLMRRCVCNTRLVRFSIQVARLDNGKPRTLIKGERPLRQSYDGLAARTTYTTLALFADGLVDPRGIVVHPGVAKLYGHSCAPL